MSLRDDINIPVVVVLGVTTGLIVAVAIVGTKAGYNYVTQVDLARNYATAEERGILHYGEKVWRPQTAALNEPAGWADVNKTSVRVPLARAKTLMVESKLKASADVKKAAEAQAAAEAKAAAAQSAGGNGGGDNAGIRQSGGNNTGDANAGPINETNGSAATRPAGK